MPRDPIQTMREVINMFKQPYLFGVTEGGIQNAAQIEKTDPDIQTMENYSDGHEQINDVYKILLALINNGGNPYPTDDLNIKSVIATFEKLGVLPALRNDPSLKDQMLYYAKLDLYTYPDTVSSQHIDEQLNSGVIPAINQYSNPTTG